MRRDLHALLRVLCGLAAMLVAFTPAVPEEGDEDYSRTGQNALTATVLIPTFDEALLPRDERLSGRWVRGLQRGSWHPMGVAGPHGLLLSSLRLAWRLPSFAGPADAEGPLERKPGSRGPPHLRLT
jgi:hypothetical protein